MALWLETGELNLCLEHWTPFPTLRSTNEGSLWASVAMEENPVPEYQMQQQAWSKHT